MAKIFNRKARKDYPKHGIKKGDMYYTASIKTGPRSSRTLRSLTPLKPSQMTSSPWKQAWFGASETLDECTDPETIREVAATIREVAEEAEASFGNMPEGLQMGDTGQMLENRASEGQERADSLDAIADELEGLEDPGDWNPDDWSDELDGLEDPEDKAEFLIEKEEEHETEKAAYEAEDERLCGEAKDLAGDMPE